jgi:tetratricopeptide (TPR) repeat protein
MNKKKVCQSCGFTSYKDDQFCPECGKKLFYSAENELQQTNLTANSLLICKNCGFGNESGFNYCGKCGSPLSEDKVKTTSSISLKRKSDKYIPLTTKLAYGIPGFFAVLVIIIMLLGKSNSFPSDTAAAMNNGGEVSKPMQAGMNMMRISELNKNLDKNPSDKNSLLELANIYHDANNPAQAISYYRKYLSMDEKNVDARIDMAICYFLAGDSQSAIQEINNALKFSPNHQKAYYNLGIITLNSGNIKESMEYFQRCFDLDPKSEAGIQAQELLNKHKTVVK